MTRYTLLQAESSLAFPVFQWRTGGVQGHNALAGYAIRQGNALRVIVLHYLSFYSKKTPASKVGEDVTFRTALDYRVLKS